MRHRKEEWSREREERGKREAGLRGITKERIILPVHK